MNPTAAIAELLGGAEQLSDVAVGSLREPLGELDRRLTRLTGPDSLAAICADLFAAGGKRLRPLATMITGNAVNLDGEIMLRLAEAVELTHGATLLHDDVIDEADTRRGRTAARRRWSNTLSILGGDYLLLRALRLAASVGAPAVLEAYFETLETLLDAEAQQHLAQRSGDITVDGYLRVAAGKTGTLFAFACAAPAITLGQEAAGKLLMQFGQAMGVAFQVADDIRDVLATDPGKTAALDLTDGVPSLPLRFAAEADPEVRAFLAASRSTTASTDDVSRVLRRVLDTGAVARAAGVGLQHLRQSESALRALTIAPKLDALFGVVAWLDAELNVDNTQHARARV